MSRRRAFVPVAALGLACVVLSACSSAASSASLRPKSGASTTRVPASTTTASTTTTTTLPAPVALYRPLPSPRPLRILVVGDSVARSFSVGLESWARETGKATVLDDARDWCSLGRFLPRDVYGPQNSSAGCDDWGTRWANDVATFDPDVVFVMFTIWEVVPRKLAGDPAGVYKRPGDPALDAWQLSEYQHAADVLSARGARVVWFSIACEGPTPIQRGEPLWYVNRRTIPALARSRPSVRLVDIDGLLCNGAHVINDFGGVANIRPDRAHYSPAGALAIAKWVMPIVLGETRAPPYAPN